MPNRRDPRPRRRRRKRRGGGLGALARPLSVLLAAVVIVAALTMFFKVDTVEVTGNVRYTDEEIVAASGVEPGDNLILFDKYRTSQRIYTDLPYITAVRINRRFPSTLTVDVTETSAVAAIQSGGAWWMLGISDRSDGAGLKLLEAAEGEPPQGSLQIVGIEADEPAPGQLLRLAEGSPVTVERLLALLDAMDAHGVLSDVTTANFSDPAVLGLWYDGRFRVELFYDADFDFKMNCLVAAAERLEPNERGTIRMTLDDDKEVHFIQQQRP